MTEEDYEIKPVYETWHHNGLGKLEDFRGLEVYYKGKLVSNRFRGFCFISHMKRALKFIEQHKKMNQQ